MRWLRAIILINTVGLLFWIWRKPDLPITVLLLSLLRVSVEVADLAGDQRT